MGVSGVARVDFARSFEPPGKALAGDIRAAQELADRAEGKGPQNNRDRLEDGMWNRIVNLFTTGQTSVSSVTNLVCVHFFSAHEETAPQGEIADVLTFRTKEIKKCLG